MNYFINIIRPRLNDLPRDHDLGRPLDGHDVTSRWQGEGVGCPADGTVWKSSAVGEVGI